MYMNRRDDIEYAKCGEIQDRGFGPVINNTSIYYIVKLPLRLYQVAVMI